MNKIRAVINSLKKDMEGIDIDKLVEMYSDNLPVAEIAHHLGRNNYEVNKVLYALQLRRKKRHRAEDYRTYLLQLNDDTSLVDEIGNLQKELDYAHKVIDSSETTVQKLKYELNRVKRSDRHNTTKSNTYDTIFDSILNGLKSTPLLSLEPKFILANRNTEVPSEGLVAVYGDTHYGEEVKKNEVPNNFYNYDVAKIRIDKFIDSIIMNPRQSSNLVLVDLKDTIKGMIHGGLLTTEGGFVTSIIEAVKINTYLYSVLSEVYDNVTIYTTGSNHERITDYIVSDGKYLDYGRLIDSMVKMQLQALNKRNVTIYTTDFGLNMFSVNGADIVAFHGDALRSFKPWEPTQRGLLQDLCLSTYSRPYRHSINGHGHQFCVCHNQYNGITLQNGTTVGTNSYGLQNGFRYLTPSQTVMFVEADGSIQDIKAVDLNIES